MSAVVIIPTTGAKTLKKAIDSVLAQTYITKAYVVCDGPQYLSKVLDISRHYYDMEKPTKNKPEVCYLPENVGADGFYGHRIYAAFSHLVSEDYVLFLDQDCWFDPNHVLECTKTMRENNVDWCHSLRKICDKEGNYLLDDNCESLGQELGWTGNNLVDTNTYCIKRKLLVELASAWHGGWGQDRRFLLAIANKTGKVICTGKHTVNYRLAGNPGSVTREFFEHGNAKMTEKYGTKFPWIK